VCESLIGFYRLYYIMKPYPDQEKSINEIMQHFETEQKLLFSLATGGGKTACFSFISKRFVQKYGGKVLVLAHRDELINQTLDTLRKIGVTCESVVSSKKTLNHISSVYVAMVKTLENRLSKDSNFLRDIGLIICDEAHLLQYAKVMEQYPNTKILGVTATPTVLKKVLFTKCSVCQKEYDIIQECCKYETYEYTRRFTLSEIYENIILGTSISQLIYDDRLVREVNYEIGGLDRNSLTIDNKTGDYDSKSSDEYFGAFDVVGNYEAIAKGKKTLIFNSSSKTNAIVLQSFVDAGYDNVKLFDSVNETENRKKVLQWFKETPGAILLNVNCFTTGFDEPTLECVILNRATLSISLFHQMVGRGGRKSNTTYKPNFIVIDGGGNIGVHGKWSDEVDWESHFFGSNEKPKPKREVLDQVKQCSECGVIHAKNILVCPECGFTEKEQIYEEKISKEIATLTDEIPKPNGKKIVDYCIRVGKDKSFAWVILQNQIIDLFIRHSVTLGMYNKAIKNERFEKSIRSIIFEPYSTIQGSQLEGTKLRTKAYIINKIKQKLDKYYETN
jgi:superfamily II DNA or RNA helicase